MIVTNISFMSQLPELFSIAHHSVLLPYDPRGENARRVLSTITQKTPTVPTCRLMAEQPKRAGSDTSQHPIPNISSASAWGHASEGPLPTRARDE